MATKTIDIVLNIITNQLNDANKRIQGLEKHLASTQKQLKKLNKENSKVNKTLKGMGKIAKTTSKSLKSIGSAIVSIGATGGIAAALFGAGMSPKVIIDSIIKFGKSMLLVAGYSAHGAREIAKMRKEFDITKTSLITLVDLMDVFADYTAQSFLHMTKQTEAFRHNLKMALNDLAQVMSVEDAKKAVTALTSAFAGKTAFIGKLLEANAADAMKLIETSGLDMAQKLQLITQYVAPQAGALVDDEDIKNLKAVQSLANQITSSLQQMFYELAHGLSGEIQTAADFLSAQTAHVIAWLKSHQQEIIEFLKMTATAIGVVTVTVIKLISWLSKAPKWALVLAGVLGGAGAGMVMGGPLGALIGGLGALGATLGVVIGVATEGVDKLKEATSYEDALKEANKAIESIRSGNKKLKEDSGKTALDPDSYGGLLAGAKKWEEGLDASLSTVQAITESFTYQHATQEKLNKLQQSSAQSLKFSGDMLEKATKARELLLAQIAEGRAKGDLSNDEMIGKMKEMADLDKIILKSQKSTYDVREAQLVPLEKAAELVREQTSLHKLDLQMVEAIYGSPALAAEAMVQVVKNIQKEKDIMKEELAIATKMRAQAERTGKGQREAQLREIKAKQKVKQLTLEQLQMVKKLRDGYIEAIQAQTFGLGAFSKLLITREKNVGLGEKMGMLRSNYLLGQGLGTAKEAGMVKSVRRGTHSRWTQGGGGRFGGAELAARQEAVAGRAGPNQQGMFQLGANMTRQVEATVRQTAALNLNNKKMDDLISVMGTRVQKVSRGGGNTNPGGTSIDGAISKITSGFGALRSALANSQDSDTGSTKTVTQDISP